MAKFLLVVLLFAAAVYLLMWTLERRRVLGQGRGGSREARPQTRQVAPDDDEDFLRWLDRKRRKGPDDGTSRPDDPPDQRQT